MSVCFVSTKIQLRENVYTRKCRQEKEKMVCIKLPNSDNNKVPTNNQDKKGKSEQKTYHTKGVVMKKHGVTYFDNEKEKEKSPNPDVRSFIKNVRYMKK